MKLKQYYNIHIIVHVVQNFQKKAQYWKMEISNTQIR